MEAFITSLSKCRISNFSASHVSLSKEMRVVTVVYISYADGCHQSSGKAAKIALNEARQVAEPSSGGDGTSSSGASTPVPALAFTHPHADALVIPS